MVQTVLLEFILLLLTVSYPERITAQRFYDRRHRPAYFSSEESYDMSSEEGYGGWRRRLSNRFNYERFGEYAIVSENSIRPLTQFGGYSRFEMDMQFFGTFAGAKYFITQDNHRLTDRTIFPGGVLVSENRLKKLYDFGKAPRRLPLLYVGQQQYEDFFLIDKSYLDALSGSLGSKTTTATPTATPTTTATRSVPGHTATVPSRDGGIPGRDPVDMSRLFQG